MIDKTTNLDLKIQLKHTFARGSMNLTVQLEIFLDTFQFAAWITVKPNTGNPKPVNGYQFVYYIKYTADVSKASSGVPSQRPLEKMQGSYFLWLYV